MDQYSDKIQSKMSKMENSLLNLTNEIITAIKFLIQLKKHSTNIVKNLNSITAPELYLNEFMNVNCFILKYQNFLTEVNCKFEMMEMLEENFKVSAPANLSRSKTESESINKADSSSNSRSIQNLNFNNTDISKNPCINKPSESNTVSSVINSNGDLNIKNHVNSDFIHDALSNKKLFFDDNEKVLQTILQTDGSDSSDFQKETLSESEASLLSSSFNSCINGKSKDTFVYETTCTSIESSVNSYSDKVKCSEVKSVTKDDHETETISAHLIDPQIQDFNCIQSSDIEKCETIELAKLKENKTQKSDIIRPVNIERKLGKEYDVIIENIKSPSEFYVVTKSHQSNELVELENKLKLIPKVKNKFFINRNESRKAWFSKEFGKYALFYSKCDEMWFRAEITNWCLNITDDFVTVFLLDSGESKCVSIDDLQSMPEIFKEYPAFAVRCHLHGVFPLDMDKNSKTLFWEKGSTEKMKSLTESSDNIRIKIAPDDSFHSPESLPVIVWLVDQGNKCVNQLLVESKYAVQESALPVDQEVQIINKEVNNTEEDKNFDNWNPMKDDFESYQNNYDLDINDPSAIIYGYVGKDYERICLHFAKTGFCFKGGACKKEHEKLDPLGFTTDQEKIYYNAFNTLPVPPPKTVMNVQITCLLTFNQFCCIPTDSFYADEESLQSLLILMNKVENVREMKKLLIPPSIGQIVIAQYSEDCSWYRARILESQPEKDLYTVLFVDYGNKETLSLLNIRAIEARYLHLPFQSMRCFIFGIDRNPKIPLKDLMDYINERIFSGYITVEVVSKLPGEGTNLLVHVFDHNGKNIGDELVAKEFAIRKSEILVSDRAESIPG